MQPDTSSTDIAGQKAQWFTTTHWSAVLAARDELSPQAAAALEKLCRTYWYPLYAFIRRRGHSAEDAQDLTQAFFARFLEKNYLNQFNRERGRFRTFLLAALNHFLADEWKQAHRQKRGGGHELISLDDPEERYVREPVDQLDAQKIFERRWVTTLFENVLARLEKEFAAAGKAELYAELRGFLLGEKTSVTSAQAGARLGLSEEAVRQAVRRLRRRYRELFREEVANTVAGPGEVDEELRYIMRVISG